MPGAARRRGAQVPAWAAGGLIGVLLAACGTDERVGSAPEPATVDWRSTTYGPTCDGIVPGGFRAEVVDGRASVPADGDRPPHDDHDEVRVLAIAAGDLGGDGGVETVGRALRSLPSPRTLQGAAPLPPRHERIAVRDGEIVGDMSAYAATDFHAGGPSEPFTVRFRLGPAGVVQVSPS